MFEQFVSFVRQLYAASPDEFVPLHVPRFRGNEKKYVLDCIDSTFVSSIGAYVNRFEQMMAESTGAKYAIAVVNGTNALHVALRIAGVKQNDLVVTQPLSFIATCNAIRYQGAAPLFIDVDSTTLGLSPSKLEEFLEGESYINDLGDCVHRASDQKIAACVPMHSFGHPTQIEEIATLCQKYHVPLIEDAAESLGSYYQGKHTGTFGMAGVVSFNGNKTVTSGGGGVILTDDADFTHKAKYLTTQAKQPHAWEYVHDEVGYNYRMPNLNAALGCAQLEQLPLLLQSKRKIAEEYAHFFENYEQAFVTEPVNSKSNFWLNTVLMKDLDDREAFLQYTNNKGVMTRPAWKLMHQLPMFLDCVRGDLTIAESLASRIVNIPSSAM